MLLMAKDRGSTPNLRRLLPILERPAPKVVTPGIALGVSRETPTCTQASFAMLCLTVQLLRDCQHQALPARLSTVATGVKRQAAAQLCH